MVGLRGDRWGGWRIGIAVALGAMLAESEWVLEFWPLGASGSIGLAMRGQLETAQLLSILLMSGFGLVIAVAACIALWERRWRMLASNLIAITAIPVAFEVGANALVFDPWLWYAVSNSARFEAQAAGTAGGNEPRYAVLEQRDVSTGYVGLSPNHFVTLIYDESDAVGLDPAERPTIWRGRSLWPGADGAPIPRGRRLYGHVFRVDVYV